MRLFSILAGLLVVAFAPFAPFALADCEVSSTFLVEFEVESCEWADRNTEGKRLGYSNRGVLIQTRMVSEYELEPDYALDSLETADIRKFDGAEQRAFFFRSKNQLLCRVRFQPGSHHLLHQRPACCDVRPHVEPICEAGGYYLEEVPVEILAQGVE